MTTKEILQSYYQALEQKGDWESFFSDQMVFVNNGKETQGKENALMGIKRFFSMVSSYEVREMVVGEDKAGAVVSYHLQAPSGATFTSDVAEFFTFQEEKISVFSIYFDTAPYPPR